jgi:hypothetical protein
MDFEKLLQIVGEEGIFLKPDFFLLERKSPVKSEGNFPVGSKGVKSINYGVDFTLSPLPTRK